MDFNQKFGLFDYFIEEDLVLYHKCSRLKNKLTLVKSDLGITICEIKNLSSLHQILPKILNNFLSDSLSLEIIVSPQYIKYFLLLKIIGINYEEMKIRFNDFKKKIAGCLNYGIKFLKFSELEETYLSIIGNNSIKSRSNLDKCKIIRSKNGYYLQTSDNPPMNKIYFSLYKLNIDSLILDPERINILIGLLQTADISGRIIFYIGKKDSFYEYSSYFICTTTSLVFLEEFLKKNLHQLKMRITNSFHPFFLGKILLRDPIKTNETFVSKSLLSVFTNLDSNFQDVKVQSHNIDDIKVDKLIDKQKNWKIKEKLKNISNLTEIELSVNKVDVHFRNVNDHSYTIFNHSILIFILKGIDPHIIDDLIDKSNTTFDCIVIFGEDYICEILKSLVNLSFKFFNKFLVVNELKTFKVILNKLSKKYVRN